MHRPYLLSLLRLLSRVGLAVLLLAARPAGAQQVLDFQYTDSLSQSLLGQQRWAALDSLGRAALAQGVAYPALRRRLGEAALACDKPAAALRHYGAALRENPLDTAARYGLVSAYLALNQREPAAFLARGLAATTRQTLHLNGFQPLIQAELETSAQSTTSYGRGTATFTRLGLSSQLSPRLTLTQNLSYYRQYVELFDPRSYLPPQEYTVRQPQYQVLLTGQLSARWQVKVSYHYLHNYHYDDQLGYAALAFTQPHYSVQAGLYVGQLNDTTRVQTDLRLRVYPFGNLRLYAFGRGSVVHSAGQNYLNGLLGVGGRLWPRVWVEAWGSLGSTPVLAELDGTYVYNLIDPLRRRGAASVLILLPAHLRLSLGAGAEQRLLADMHSTYALYSLITALSWTW